jgi:hypothetical protein
MKASEAIAVAKNGLGQVTSTTKETAGDLADMLEGVGLRNTRAEFEGQAIVVSAYLSSCVWRFTVQDEAIKFYWED